jgi:microcystin-dependent protein
MTLRLNGSTSGYTEIDAPTVAGSNTLVLPTDNGSWGQALSTNGLGALSWSEVMPAGLVMWAASNTAPSGFLKANGASTLSRTAYTNLFAAIGTTFGSGNGSTTFAIPDLRGEFIRGWDDARGIDTSRPFGSGQIDEFKSHTHSITPSNVAGRAGTFTAAPGPQVLSDENLVIGAAGGVETRPRNVALLACIKY